MENKMLTLEQTMYLYRGTLAEMRGEELPNAGKNETTRLFSRYIFSLHGADSRPDAQQICLATLKRLAKLWEYYLDGQPDKFTREVAEGIVCRQQIIAAAV